MLSLTTGWTWEDKTATALPVSGTQIQQLSTTGKANL